MALRSRQELIQKINSFEYWHYPFDLGNGIVINPTKQYRTKNAQEIRNFVWPVVLELCGGSLKGLRVLDIACNAGFWSLEAHRSGADYVLGFDARPTHIKQARFVRDALGIDSGQIEYRHMDIYDLSRESVGGEYDLVLMFRILNHLSNPLLALDKIREVCRGCLVADIRMVKHESPILSINVENPGSHITGVDLGLGLRPSSSAVALMFTHSRFIDLKEIPPKQPLPANYFDGTRSLFTARV